MVEVDDLTSYMAWVNDQRRSNIEEIEHLRVKIKLIKQHFYKEMKNLAISFGKTPYTIEQLQNAINGEEGKEDKIMMITKPSSNVNRIVVGQRALIAQWRIEQLQEDIEEMEQMKVALEACAEYQVAKLAMQKLKEESSKATASIAAAERRRASKSPLSRVDAAAELSSYSSLSSTTFGKQNEFNEKLVSSMHEHALSWCPKANNDDTAISATTSTISPQPRTATITNTHVGTATKLSSLSSKKFNTTVSTDYNDNARDGGGGESNSSSSRERERKKKREGETATYINNSRSGTALLSYPKTTSTTTTTSDSLQLPSSSEKMIIGTAATLSSSPPLSLSTTTTSMSPPDEENFGQFLAWINQQNRINHRHITHLRAKLDKERQRYFYDIARLEIDESHQSPSPSTTTQRVLDLSTSRRRSNKSNNGPLGTATAASQQQHLNSSTKQ
mmetsp:Transcript_19459/g.31705  ORF Transcript_19459/g.31705 Transcript_19459/m.31705 type:complete len:446 (-) Transcript_19459:203-1540(-)